MTSCRVSIPDRSGDILLDDAVLDRWRELLASLPEVPRSRLAFAAARVVMSAGYGESIHSQDNPGDPAEIVEYVDWEATATSRKHLLSHGFGIAEAMDTAQRSAVGWPVAMRLFELHPALDSTRSFIGGAGADHLPEISSSAELVEAVAYQARFIQAHGGIPMILSLPWLCQQEIGEDETVEIYRAIIGELEGPLFVHWLGPMFAPELSGYFPGESFSRVMALDPSKVRGCKISLLDEVFEQDVRKKLKDRDQIVLTGDDHHFVDLIVGKDALPERFVEISEQSVAVGDFSHALLGVLDAIAVPAAMALGFLDRGMFDVARELLIPCEELGAVLFEEPTMHYKAGLAFLAWINGRQENFFLANRQEKERDRSHYLRLVDLANRAGAIEDAEFTANRLETWLGREK